MIDLGLERGDILEKSDGSRYTVRRVERDYVELENMDYVQKKRIQRDIKHDRVNVIKA